MGGMAMMTRALMPLSRALAPTEAIERMFCSPTAERMFDAPFGYFRFSRVE